MSISKLKEESGYTLVEIMVALSMSFIVIGLGYAALHFTQVRYKEWQVQEQVMRKQHTIQKMIYNDISQARKVLSIEPNLLQLQDKRDSLLVYSYKDSILYRNERIMNNKQLPMLSCYFLGDEPESIFDFKVFMDQLESQTVDNDLLQTDSTFIQCVQFYYEIQNPTGEILNAHAVINLRNKEY